MKKFIEPDLPADKIKQILDDVSHGIDPLYELLRTMDSVFHFIRHLQINEDLKEAFEPLKLQYEFYSSLVLMQRKPENFCFLILDFRISMRKQMITEN